MDDAVVVGVVECGGDLNDVSDGDIWGQGVGFFEDGVEGFAFEKFHGEVVEAVRGASRIEDAADIFV